MTWVGLAQSNTGRHTSTKVRPILERFWEKVERTETCWVWHGARGLGYGRFRIYQGLMMTAHRFSFLTHGGYIPDGYTIDHLCKNPACVNPAHMEPVTNGENSMRGEGQAAQNARKTHCKHGHEFTDTNTIMLWYNGKKRRRCRECSRTNARRFYTQQRSIQDDLGRTG